MILSIGPSQKDINSAKRLILRNLRGMNNGAADSLFIYLWKLYCIISKQMKSIENTAEVLAYKVLNRLTDKVWIDWAFKMLLSDIETESLLIMAGLQEPLNYFQMRSLTDKVFNELGLDYWDEEKIITSYASYLISECLDSRIDAPTVLYRLNDIYISTEYIILSRSSLIFITLGKICRLAKHNGIWMALIGQISTKRLMIFFKNGSLKINYCQLLVTCLDRACG